MLGLGVLGFFSYHIRRHEGRVGTYDGILGVMSEGMVQPYRELRNYEGAIKQVVDHSLHPTFAIDAQHKITHWNKDLEELTGLSAETQIGTDNHWSPFYKEKRETLADLIVSGTTQEEFEERYPERVQKNKDIKDAYDAADFFPHIGEKGSWLTFTAAPIRNDDGEVVGSVEMLRPVKEEQRERAQVDLMRTIARAEWDTLLFFYGVILCVGGLAQFGYLHLMSTAMYADLGPTMANSIVGVLSAIVDNIPVMFAVLTMDPVMPHEQWLLVTLTAGVGGSLLAIGSAAGVALLGTARGVYTFGAHLRWTPVIALGYIASILCHLLLNGTGM